MFDINNMAVQLTDLVDGLKREVSPPGSDLYPDTNDAEWEGRLADAFWQARLDGLLTGWEIDDSGTNIIPSASGPDMPRELQRLVVLYAGFNVALTSFVNINSSIKYKAGPVEQEVQKSAQVLKGVLDALRERIKNVLTNLSTYAAGSVDTAAFDAVIERTYATAYGEQWWVR